MAAVEKFRPLFASHQYEIPPVKVSCGFGAKNPLKTLGECWSSECTPDGTRQIFVSPIHKDAISTLGTLVHELLHACLPNDAKHGKPFKEGMAKIGLEGPARSAGPGAELQLFVEKVADELGDYPNVPITPKQKKKSDRAASKRTFKLYCPKKRNNDKGCTLTELTKDGDYTITGTRKSLKLGFPLCPCGTEMVMEDEDFELYKLGDQ